MNLKNYLLLIAFRFGFLLLFFNSFSNDHPLIKYYDGKLKLSEKQVKSLVDQTIEEGDSEYLLALAFYQRGFIERNRGNDISEFKNYTTALEYLQEADTTDNYLLSALWRNQGLILHNYKLYAEAAKVYEKAQEPSYKYSNKRGASTEYNIGLALMQFDPKKALTLFLKLQDQVKEDIRRQARIYNQLGLFQKRVEKYDKAIAYYKRGLELGVKGRVKADLLQNISEVYYHQEDYLNQERFLLQTLEISEANQFIALMDLGECYIQQGRAKEARMILLEAVEIYDQQPLNKDHIKVFEWLKKVSVNRMFYADKQIEEQTKYIERMDTLKEMMKTLAMKNMLVAFDADKKRKDEKSFYSMLASIGGLAALAILMTWRIWLYRLRKNLGKEILSLTEGKPGIP